MAVFVPNKSSYEDSLPETKRDNLRLDGRILVQATSLVVGRKEQDERLARVEKALALIAEQNNHIIEKLNGRN